MSAPVPDGEKDAPREPKEAREPPFAEEKPLLPSSRRRRPVLKRSQSSAAPTTMGSASVR